MRKDGDVPVMLVRDDRRWRVSGCLSSTAEHVDRIANYGRGTALEWVFLLLEAPPPCA